jgi:predicted nucleotidyltransferase component of viral defense system
MSRASQAKGVMDALKVLAKTTKGGSINELRVIVAMERAIARLERHPRLASHLVFKGGFVLLKTVETTRFTRDVDALALGIPRERVPDVIDRALKLDLDDGLWFGDLETEDLVDQGPYGGYRFNCAFQIGDPVTFVPAKQTMPSILSGGEPVSWSVYPLEYIFAEKLQALFSRGSASSRAKDVYDMPIIFAKCDRSSLLKAVEHTFEHRETSLPMSLSQAARSFDLTILRAAWPSVELADASRSFEETWRNFVACLDALDVIKSTRKFAR